MDIGRAAFTTALNAISNTFFSTNLAENCSNASQEFLDLIVGSMEEAGTSNIANYFPALRLVDPQGARRRMNIYFRNFFVVLDGIMDKRLQLRASSKGSKASSDVLDSLLDHIEEDNAELSYDHMKHLFQVYFPFQSYFDHYK